MILGIPVRPGLRVMVAAKPIDFRKGMDGLVAMVTEVLAADPFAGDVFIFRSKRTDRLKLIFWDKVTLMVLCTLCLLDKRFNRRWGGSRRTPGECGSNRDCISAANGQNTSAD